MVGASTVLLAQAFPESEFIGYDYHSPSIDIARKRAAEAALNNARFEVADATGYKEKDFDLIAFFDCLHDMDDPVGAARHARQALKPDGNCMFVEPFAGDCVEDNLNPGGTCILRCLIADLRSGVARPKRAGAWRAGRRETIA